MSDLKDLVEIFELNTPTYFDEKEIIDFENFLKLEPETHYVAVIGQKVVGCCGYKVDHEHNEGQITWVLFHPDFQGKGVGKKLVNHCLRELNNFNTLKKHVVRTSQLAYRFFEKFGFKTEYTDQNYWGEGLDLYYMSLISSAD